jgi:glycine cleavage system H protein
VKFVGPLTSPVSGTVLACNAAAVADPGLVERDAFGDGWLIEAELSDAGELGALLSGAGEIIAWYAASIEEYRLSGAIAE